MYFIFSICVWNVLIYTLFCQGETQNILILDIDEKNKITYVFACTGTLGSAYELKSSITSNYLITCLNNALEQ